MEPYITDAVNYVIRTKEMIPAFKEGDYYTGIDNAVDAIIGLASGAFTAEEYADEDGDALGILVLFLAIMVVFVLISASGKGKGGRKSNSGFWRGLLWGILLSGGNRGGHHGGGYSGGSWGGGHGGGFGGFGGGHFGGGGGSSKW